SITDRGCGRRDRERRERGRRRSGRAVVGAQRKSDHAIATSDLLQGGVPTIAKDQGRRGEQVAADAPQSGLVDRRLRAAVGFLPYGQQEMIAGDEVAEVEPDLEPDVARLWSERRGRVRQAVAGRADGRRAADERRVCRGEKAARACDAAVRARELLGGQ